MNDMVKTWSRDPVLQRAHCRMQDVKGQILCVIYNGLGSNSGRGSGQFILLTSLTYLHLNRSLQFLCRSLRDKVSLEATMALKSDFMSAAVTGDGRFI